MKKTFAEIIDKMRRVVTSGKDTAENNWGLASPGELSMK
jgi:hypothetical protein